MISGIVILPDDDKSSRCSYLDDYPVYQNTAMKMILWHATNTCGQGSMSVIH
jgi:hypothetical protein